jgi:hypothetical protein
MLLTKPTIVWPSGSTKPKFGFPSSQAYSNTHLLNAAVRGRGPNAVDVPSVVRLVSP